MVIRGVAWKLVSIYTQNLRPLLYHHVKTFNDCFTINAYKQD